jgi:hypothetical protein
LSKRITRAAVNTFAVIENFRNGSTDILDGLLPFFQPILEDHFGETYNPDKFASDVREAYKWNFTSDIAEELIPRFEAASWLSKDNPNLEHSTYSVVGPQPEERGVDDETLAKFDLVASQFKDFCSELTPLTAVNLSRDECKDILIEWLLYVDAYSEKNLDFTIRNFTDENGTLSRKVVVPKTTSLTDDQRYLCARFVEQAIKSDGDVADHLCKLASIGLLTEVVQDFHRPTSSVEKTDLIVYLDAPIAMEFIGVSGRAARENIEPIVNELQNIGAQIRVFQQSVNEISRNLNAVLKSPTRTGPTARALAQGSVMEAFIRDVARDPAKFLLEKDVRVTLRELEQLPSEHHFFSDERYRELYSSFSFQQNPNARDHDAKVATFIMRQRKGAGSSDIFGSKFLLLTRNGLVAQITRRTCIGLGALSPQNVSPVVHRRMLATALWLRTGLGKNENEIPKRQLLASCERILSINPRVVNAVKKFSSSLTSEKAEQLDLLLSQDRSSQMLMDKTLGISDVVTSENVSILFDEMLVPHLEEVRSEGEEALAAEKIKSKKRLEEQRKITEIEAKKTTDYLAEINARDRNDQKILEAVFSDVETELKGKRFNRKALAIVIALVVCLPGFGYLGSSNLISIASFAVAAYLAYLSLTGSNLMGTITTKSEALEKLKMVSKQRAMDELLDRFQIDWNGRNFSIVETEVKQPTKLLV